jgi:hypothetical protein
MNELQIQNRFQETDCRYFVPELLVDGVPLDDFSAVATDLAALHASISSPGEHYILTCWCGEPGCAGIAHGIKVLHRGQTVHWHIRDPQPKRHFQFEASAYRTAIDLALSEACDILRRDPPPPEGTLEVVPDSNTAFLQALHHTNPQ